MADNQELLRQVTSLIGSGRQGDAIALVQDAARAGDDWAAVCLAQWKLEGQGITRDPAGAVALLEASMERGDPAAAMRLITLYTTGTGCDPNPDKAWAMAERIEHFGGSAAAQLAFLRLNDEPEPAEREILSAEPLVARYAGFVSRAECSWIKNFAKPALEPSFVEEPGTGRRIPHPVRTSHGMSFGPFNEDLVVNRITRRIARVTGTDYSWGEPLHVLQYAGGQEYRPHFDALPGVTNQRQLTAILYCNAGYGGGETAFPALDLKVSAEEGDMLLFANLDDDGRTEKRSEHAGLPVTAGEKWIATRWIRQRRYHPWEPQTAR